MLLIGAVVTAFAVRDVVGFEPLPAVVTPDNIREFLDFRRYFGIWPGVAGIVGGVGFCVMGLLVSLGLGVGPLPTSGATDHPPPAD